MLVLTNYHFSDNVFCSNRDLILEYYHTYKGPRELAKPSQIIVYRDGVSESQFDQCLEQELVAFKRVSFSISLPFCELLNLRAIHHFIVFFNFTDTCCDLSQACNAIEEGYNPGITFIVAQKRHNTRFFPSNPQSRDILPKNGNVLPGYSPHNSSFRKWYYFTFMVFEVYTWYQKIVLEGGLE